MERPEVRIIDHQREEIISTDVTGSEADYLLAKYGYGNSQNNHSVNFNPDSTLTADQMWAKQEQEQREIERREHQRRYGPQSITFDSDNIKYSNTEYRDFSEEGIGIKIQIVSDMKL
jgi:hypothetical protein